MVNTAVFILYMWGVVAAGSGGRLYADWRPMGEFSGGWSAVSIPRFWITGEERCNAAAASLGVTPANYRCIIKAGP